MQRGNSRSLWVSSSGVLKNSLLLTQMAFSIKFLAGEGLDSGRIPFLLPLETIFHLLSLESEVSVVIFWKANF